MRSRNRRRIATANATAEQHTEHALSASETSENASDASETTESTSAHDEITADPSEPSAEQQQSDGATAGTASFAEPDEDVADATLLELEAELARYQVQRSEMEREEEARMKTPLCLQPMVVSCSLANITYPAGESIPTFTFPTHPCPYGKEQPDQDCRGCTEVALIPYGLQHLAPHRRRYLRHGMIYPLRTNAEAETVAKVLDAMNIKSLRHIGREVHALERAIALRKQQLDAERREDLERRQGKRP